jgi:hypothetical protein
MAAKFKMDTKIKFACVAKKVFEALKSKMATQFKMAAKI